MIVDYIVDEKGNGEEEFEEELFATVLQLSLF